METISLSNTKNTDESSNNNKNEDDNNITNSNPTMNNSNINNINLNNSTNFNRNLNSNSSTNHITNTTFRNIHNNKRNNKTKRLLRKILGYRLAYSTSDMLHLIVPSLLYLFVCLYIICIFNSIMDRRNPSIQKPLDERQRLPDVILEFFYPKFLETNLPYNLSDTLVQIAVLLVAFRALISGRLCCVLLRRVFFVAGTVYLIRAPFISVTVLPNPLLSCESHPLKPLAYDALVLLFQLRASCGDVFFSGHTILFTSVILLYTRYPIKSVFKRNKNKQRILNAIIKAIAIIYGVMGMFSLIFTAYHYTIDVVVSFVFCFVIWKFYHAIVQEGHFTNKIIGRIIIWYDKDPYPKRKFIRKIRENKKINQPTNNDNDSSTNIPIYVNNSNSVTTNVNNTRTENISSTL